MLSQPTLGLPLHVGHRPILNVHDRILMSGIVASHHIVLVGTTRRSHGTIFDPAAMLPFETECVKDVG